MIRVYIGTPLSALFMDNEWWLANYLSRSERDHDGGRDPRDTKE
jgi:hypothetical protein